MPDPLLVIEDEELLAAELVRRFERQGWRAQRVADLAGARRALLGDELDPLVVLSDLHLPDGNALDLLEELRARRPGGEWVLLTGVGTVPDSVRALRLGAYDFLEKPCDAERLDLVVAGAARSARAQRRLREEAGQEHARHAIESFVGTSEAARGVRELLGRLCEVPWSALVIGGETGTGKGLAARILHYNGRRAAHPLVELNCAALPRELLESELFGHEPGAFTGARGRRRGLLEQASGGTLFLDEIGEMDPDLQAKLLKVIEDGRVRPLGAEREVAVDLQVVAASNRDLAGLARAGEFRSDLYHRLSVFGLVLPPLRERREDLAELVPRFVAEYNAKAGKRVRLIPDPVWKALEACPWPGNVRELRNAIERCVLFSEGETFPERWLQLPGSEAEPPARPEPEGDRVSLPLDGSLSLEAMEREILARALEQSGGNLARAARLLGTTRQTLRYRVQKHRLKPAGGPGGEG